MKRFKTITLASLLLGTAFFLEGYRENRQLEKSFYTIESSKLKKEKSHIKIAHLSDTQFPRLRVPMSKLLSCLENEQPDLILYTGDTIDRTENIKTTELTYFLKKVTKIAPTYIVSGNHETSHPNYNEWHDIVTNSDAKLLENEVVHLTIKNEQIQLVGFSESSTKLPANEKQKIDSSLETLVLAHHPEKIEEYIHYLSPTSITTFSGHAHGGQIQIPGVGGLFSPNQGFLPEYTDGLYDLNDNHLIVSRGLANSSFPTRINNYPHLIFTTYIKKKG
ncbi:metallophosphoesterase [Vagococcus fluvialis]|uniref:metallophosphoesterase n=1 Tax=Vagococcus fluvialis TaxID=2738 RepID=UPI003B5CDE73